MKKLKLNYFEKSWILSLPLLFSSFATILILHYIFKYCFYGVDFTDDGYYLNWISNPFLYKNSLSQFGFIYYPLGNFVDGNISLLRRINFLLTFVISFNLIFFLIGKVSKNYFINKIHKIILSGGIAVSAFSFVYSQTPSYNHLTLQALMLTGIGILLINNNNDYKNFLAYLIIGIGGWLTFMAKPSSGIGLGLLTIIYLLLSNQFKIKFIFVSLIAASFLFIMSALIIDGSISLYIERYFSSLKLSKLLQSGYGIKNLFRIDNFIITSKLKNSIFYVTILVVILFWINYQSFKIENFILINISFFIVIIIFIMTFLEIDWNPNYGRYQPYQFIGITLAGFFISIYLIKKKKIKFFDFEWSLIFFYLFLPYVFALGTNNNYWRQSGIASIFWLISGFIFIIPICLKFKKIFFLTSVVLISQLILSIHIKERIEKPYRQNQPLRLNDTSVKLDEKMNVLILSKEFADYINNVKNITSKSGFKKGYNMIDLTGQSPGLLYLIGATSIGTAWNIGGYPGSLDVAKAKFSKISCDSISDAWILYEINGSRNISIELMQSLGFNFPNDYKLVGSWEVNLGDNENRFQELYKPQKIKNMSNSCKLLRK